MIHRLNVILKTCSKYKLRKSYIKYLESLDYDEFKFLLFHYTTIAIRLMYRYHKEDKPKIFSKKWFRNKLLRIKYNDINSIFLEANPDFVIEIGNNLKISNDRKTKLIAKLTEIRNTIVNINSQSITIKTTLTKEDMITLFVWSVDYMYMNAEFKKVLEEINSIE